MDMLSKDGRLPINSEKNSTGHTVQPVILGNEYSGNIRVQCQLGNCPGCELGAECTNSPLTILPTETFLTSDDFNDPKLGQVLGWHIGCCWICLRGQRKPPPEFGRKDTRKCPEYYEIIDEYAEYEGQYAWKGNP